MRHDSISVFTGGNMRFSFKNFLQFTRDILHTLIHGDLDSSDFIIIDELEVVFASVAKSGSSSIKTSIFGEFSKDRSIHYHISDFSNKRIPKNKRSYFSFSYVRNPYDRVLSCYNNKFNMKDESEFLYSNYLFGYLKNEDSLEDFVRKISKIPNFLCDRHFKTQYSIIHSKGAIMNHIGRLENIKEDYEDIRKRYDFNELTILNKTKDPKEQIFLSEELKEKIFEKFEIDFREFGYSK